MVKVISKYQIRILNHNGDLWNLVITLVLGVLFAYLRYVYKFE